MGKEYPNNDGQLDLFSGGFMKKPVEPPKQEVKPKPKSIPKAPKPKKTRVLYNGNEIHTYVFNSVTELGKTPKVCLEEYFSLLIAEYGQTHLLVFRDEPYLDSEWIKKFCVGCRVSPFEESIERILRKKIFADIEYAFKMKKEASTKQYKIKKKDGAMKLILKYSKSFKGEKSDKEVMNITGLSNNTYYKYKKELRNRMKLMGW